VYTEKVNKVRGYVKGKLGNLWKQRSQTNRNLSKKMVRLKIDLKREIKGAIENVMGTKPLKNICFDRIISQVRITVTKQNAFKGLDYSALYQENPIGPMSLFRIYSVRQADYKVL